MRACALGRYIGPDAIDALSALAERVVATRVHAECSTWQESVWLRFVLLTTIRRDHEEPRELWIGDLDRLQTVRVALVLRGVDVRELVRRLVVLVASCVGGVM